ncbi:hypothetical protein D3H65_13155 [Paraflavitalea soli]|uniref:Lipoprotein n=1 Tax=Paraflavitalea soli TaxID=2315862 RepID=A0A3B7MTB2_9BACT|nr:hypothetical protein [Paraflavitalea soli]AXY74875.1 hypothetical protein D3H65_13155 [Paraflavitalea soli]
MKKTTFLISLILITLAACNRGTTIKKGVSYQGDVMRIEVYARIDGRKVQDFKKEYNVAGMDKEEREAMAKQIMDSLNIPDNAGK